MVENAIIQEFNCDILSHFQTNIFGCSHRIHSNTFNFFKLTYIGLPCYKGMLDATDRFPEHGANEQWTNHDPPTKWPSCCGLTRSLAKA